VHSSLLCLCTYAYGRWCFCIWDLICLVFFILRSSWHILRLSHCFFNDNLSVPWIWNIRMEDLNKARYENKLIRNLIQETALYTPCVINLVYLYIHKPSWLGKLTLQDGLMSFIYKLNFLGIECLSWVVMIKSFCCQCLRIIGIFVVPSYSDTTLYSMTNGIYVAMCSAEKYLCILKGEICLFKDPPTSRRVHLKMISSAYCTILEP